MSSTEAAKAAVARPLSLGKRIAYTTLALALSGTLLIAASEIILRLFVGRAFSVAADSPLEPSPLPGLHYQLRANYTSPKVSTDEYSFRKRAVGAAASEQSILMLGDSIAFSSGLDYSKSFSSILEQRFSSALGESVAVWNGAAPGYNTDQEAAQFELAGPRIRPQVTILEFCMNDYLDPPVLMGSGKLDATTPSENTSFSISDFVTASRTYVFTKEKIKDLQETWPEWFPNSLHYVHFVHHKPGWQRSKAALLRMKATAERLGSRFLLVIFPMEQQLRIAERDALDDMMKFAGDNGIEVVDLYPALQPHWREGLYVGNWVEIGSIDTLHLNDRGHKIVAEQIYNAVSQRQWLSATPTP
jgi:hypothetical protein